MNTINNTIKTIIISLIVITFSSFCMDEPALPGPLFFKNLPNPEQEHNRDTIILILSTHPGYPNLQYAAKLINHLASNYPKFNVFLNKPNNFIALAHNLSRMFYSSDLEVCQALDKIRQASRQIKRQNKFNLKISQQQTPPLVDTIDPNFTANSQDGIITPLITSIISDNEIMLDNLLKAKVNPNEGKYKGDTPLTLCIRKGNEKFVHKLLKSGADRNLCGDSDYPLAIAHSYGNAKIIRLLRNGK